MGRPAARPGAVLFPPLSPFATPAASMHLPTGLSGETGAKQRQGDLRILSAVCDRPSGIRLGIHQSGLK
jgi:hypothetical protein